MKMRMHRRKQAAASFKRRPFTPVWAMDFSMAADAIGEFRRVVDALGSLSLAFAEIARGHPPEAICRRRGARGGLS